MPFLVAGPLGIVGLYLRLKLDDTPAFLRLEEGTVHSSEAAGAAETTTRGDLATIFRQHWRTLLLCVDAGRRVRHQRLHAAVVHADVPLR
ncbi:hypothetical protein SGLAM104S_01719 [Streptomyces glaucescens]